MSESHVAESEGLLSIEKHDGYLVVRCKKGAGAINFDDVGNLKEIVIAEIDDDCQFVFVNLNDVAYFGAALSALLLGLHKFLRQKNGSLVLSNANAMAKEH